jgi:hypothetical protein
MHLLTALLFFLSQPFWEAKPPEQWTTAELDTMLHASPWTQTVGPAPNLILYLATAQPIEEAEVQTRLRKKGPLHEPDPDYSDFLRENREKVFVLAIPYPDLSGLGKAEETKSLERDTKMVVSGKSYRIAGYFPPTPSDPELRLVFPREIKPSDKNIDFDLYFPGLPFPEREAQFHVKDLMYHGKLAM